ncbi:MAG: glycosyl hydrolase family 59, partial [Ruminococcus sp.]|nr:glycosyl hydrolase family 59 [Ruminococcus sp.]
MLFRKMTALICAAALALSAMPMAAFAETDGQGAENMKEILIDGSTADARENSLWRGFGFISANNSSRLLLDYKAEQPEVYDRLLKLLFDPEGSVRMSHFKLEMGADINSSSGTEPCTKRTLDEAADVTRGAGFQLAADVKKINPDVTLELLSWGLPAYVKDEKDLDKKRKLRYRWFKETLDAAYETYGLEFDYIDPNINERAVDAGWIKYFSEHLKAETGTPYDYGKIKILIADEECGYSSARMMLADEELMGAVDAVGIHYTSTSDENTLRVKDEFGKELFYSEGIAPCTVERYTVNADGSGLSGVNSVLDVAGRIVNMYPNGGFTMYEFQPAIAAYYSGANYFPKQLITANEPWSGYTETGAGLYMTEHFSAFSQPGWQFVTSGCYGDGTEENHVLYDTTDNYMTLADPDTGDYSTVYVNNTASERRYTVKVKGLAKAGEPVKVWETKGPDEGQAYDNNYLRNIMSVTPEQQGGEYTYQLNVKPHSMVTVTTLDSTPQTKPEEVEQSRLTMPYSDDFEYSDYPESYLSSRGCAPRYTTDIGGAFEVAESDDGNVLEQKITDSLRGSEWGYTPEPVTTFGDDSWANYSLSADVKLAEDGYDADNYAGVAVRYINASAPKSRSGYGLLLHGDGSWQLTHM